MFVTYKYKPLTQPMAFRRKGYDPVIDYIKGICILLIVLQHSLVGNTSNYLLFDIWGSCAVPILLIIQVFHVYKTGLSRKRIDFLKIWNRIAKPFFLIEILILLYKIIIEKREFNVLISETIRGGGLGPGAFYPWIYFQFTFLIIFLIPIMKKNKGKFLYFVMISQLLEFICCITDISDSYYRLLFFRYFFLLYLGYIISIIDLKTSKKTILPIILSLLCLLEFRYIDLNLRPIFYTGTIGWRTCHWICYFYMLFLMFLIYQSYIYNRSKTVKRIIINIGKNSYLIFLIQILFFATIGYEILLFLSNYNLIYLYTLLAMIICVSPVLLYNHIVKNWI